MERKLAHIAVTSAWYGACVPVLDEVTLDVFSGQCTALMGENGCGKTTLLRIIAGLHSSFKGEREIAAQVKIAYMPQRGALLPWYTVAKNMYALAGSRAAGAKKLLGELGIAGCADSLPHALSGGQYQRAALAAALFCAPDILLLDEPFSALDGAAKDAALGLFQRFLDEKGGGVLVTHDAADAQRVGAQVLRL